MQAKICTERYYSCSTAGTIAHPYPEAARGQLGSVAEEMVPYNSRCKSCSTLGSSSPCQCARRVSWDLSFGIAWRSRRISRDCDSRMKLSLVVSCLLLSWKVFQTWATIPNISQGSKSCGGGLPHTQHRFE